MPKLKISYSKLIFIIVASILTISISCYIVYQAAISKEKLFPLSIFALFAGLIFESFRIGDNWKTVLGIFAGSLCLSFLGFWRWKSEKVYNFENHIHYWPYIFLGIYAIIFAIIHKDKVIAKLHEGSTLLLSLSLIYWVFDRGLVSFNNWPSITLLCLILLFCIFSFLNALTNISLDRTTRLILSVWSTIILLVFAFSNIYNIFHSPDLGEARTFMDNLSIGVQYFLLGISTIYIAQNIMLITPFIPNKNSNYLKDLRENNREHINRYSDQQVKLGHSLFCILFAGGIYLFNYHCQFLPRLTVIWLVLFIFPFLLNLSSFRSHRYS